MTRYHKARLRSARVREFKKDFFIGINIVCQSNNDNKMVEVFKSPINLQKESSVREVAKSVSITIGANASARATVPFAKTYVTTPFVHYSVICDDEKFGLSHYITSITTSGFVIVIENQDSTERIITVMYEVLSD